MLNLAVAQSASSKNIVALAGVGNQLYHKTSGQIDRIHAPFMKLQTFENCTYTAN